MQNVRVTPEMVQQASASSLQAADTIWQQMAELQAYVRSVEQVWHGVAQDAFQALMADWDVYAKMLHEALTDIGRGLQGNYVNYRETEAAAIRNLQPVDGDRMPGSSLPQPRF